MFQKGNNANPEGAFRYKPFRDALKAEIAAKGSDHRALRRIARRLLKEAEAGNMAAITEVANRLDGKPAQETTLHVDDKRDATDWTRAELVAFLSDEAAGGEGIADADGRNDEPDRLH